MDEHAVHVGKVTLSDFDPENERFLGHAGELPNWVELRYVRDGVQAPR